MAEAVLSENLVGAKDISVGEGGTSFDFVVEKIGQDLGLKLGLFDDFDGNFFSINFAFS